MKIKLDFVKKVFKEGIVITKEYLYVASDQEVALPFGKGIFYEISRIPTSLVRYHGDGHLSAVSSSVERVGFFDGDSTFLRL